MAVTSIHTSSPSLITNVIRAQYGSGKMSMPVQRDQSLFAKFKHIFGMPALGKGEGLPIVKLRALDNLIDRIIKIKGNRAFVKDVSGLSGDMLSSLKDTYLKELHSAVAQTPSPFYGSFSEAGVILNIMA